jgi:2-hydroxy-3-oxopropionate reductase
VSTHLKDMNNILECAGDFDTKLPISSLIKEMFNSLVERGNDNDDHSALYKEIENQNKIK